MTRNEPRRRRLGWFRSALKLLCVLAVTYLVLPLQFGGRASYVVIAGPSMQPTYHTYDLVITYRLGTPKVHDVIVYRVPKGEPGEGKQVIHRIVGGDPVSGYVTQGDNREGPDIWHPRRGDVVGRVVLLVPRGGRLFAVVVNPFNLAIAAVGLLAWAVWPRKEEPSAPAPADDSPVTT